MSVLSSHFGVLRARKLFHCILGTSTSAIYMQPGEQDTCMLPLVLCSLPGSASTISSRIAAVSVA